MWATSCTFSLSYLHLLLRISFRKKISYWGTDTAAHRPGVNPDSPQNQARFDQCSTKFCFAFAFPYLDKWQNRKHCGQPNILSLWKGMSRMGFWVKLYKLQVYLKIIFIIYPARVGHRIRPSASDWLLFAYFFLSLMLIKRHSEINLVTLCIKAYKKW